MSFAKRVLIVGGVLALAAALGLLPDGADQPGTMQLSGRNVTALTDGAD